MKAVVNNDALLKELKKMTTLIRKNPVIPIMGSVKMEFGKNVLTLTATDLETTYISVIDCECKTPFSVPLDHAKITEVCSSVSAPLQLELKEKSVFIVSGKSKHTIAVAGDAIHFPATPVDEYDIELPVEGEFFFYLNNANTCRSKEEIKVNLNMAAIDVQKKNITVVGTDANYLYKKTMDCKSKKEVMVMVCDMFVQSCKNFQISTLFIGEKFIKAVCGNDIVISRLSDNKFVNYRSIIPAEIKYNLPVNKNELKAAVKSISVSTNQLSKLCTLNFIKGGIKLVSQNIDFGDESETEIDVEHNVTTESISVNAGLLNHLLSVIDDSEIELSVSEPNRTMFIKPKYDNSLLLLLQPISNQN